MSEDKQDMEKVVTYLLIFTAITFLLGALLYNVVGNIWFNELFYSNDILYTIFSLITELGDTRVFIFLIVIVWYIYDKRFAKNLAFSLLGSGYVNNLIKDIFQDPRPYTNIRDFGDGPEAVAEGYGFPSGHSQTGMAVYGYLAYEAHVKKSQILCWIFSILVYIIAASRIIIGVHDIQDVWGGLTFGYIWLIFVILFEPKLSEIISKMSMVIKLVLSVVIPIILFIIAIFVFPVPTGDYGMMCGAMMGIGLGYTLETEYIKYDPRELDTKQRILNLVIGIVITLVLYLGLSFAFPESQIMDLIQYLLLSIILVTLVPWLFIKINRK